MKKFILLITVLFISVISTACINNLAVQELNNKAKEYMANGEPEKAVCRLRSSIDLDTNIFETHYNLGVALIETKEYKDAQISLETAINLKPDFADSYYSLAIAYENQADEIISKDAEEPEIDDETAQKPEVPAKTLTAEEKLEVVKLLNKAVDNYNLYIEKQTAAKDIDKIHSQINYINDQIKKYGSDELVNDDNTKAYQDED